MQHKLFAQQGPTQILELHRAQYAKLEIIVQQQIMQIVKHVRQVLIHLKAPQLARLVQMDGNAHQVGLVPQPNVHQVITLLLIIHLV